MKHPEQQLQQEIAGYLRGHLVPPAFFTAIGHGSRGGGNAGFLRGIIAKQMGVKPNLPDLYFRHPTGLAASWCTAWCTAWIELKVPGAAVPASQHEFHDVLRSWGDWVAVCRSLDEVRAQLVVWGFELSVEKLSTERMRRGFVSMQTNPAWRDAVADFPVSDTIGRRRRKAAP